MMRRTQLVTRMRHILLRRREGLLRTLSGELGRFSAWEEPVVGDAIDDALDADYGAVTSQLAETESRELTAIETALERIRQGQYGVCENCGRTIPTARLRALPYASTCVVCQRIAESERARHEATADWSRVDDTSDGAEELTFDSIELVS